MSAPPDPLDVLAALGIHDARVATPITEGLGDTSLWRVQRDSSSAVLRLFPPGWERVAEREVLAQAAAARAGVPVPAVEARGAWQGRPALVLAWLPGQTLLQALDARPGQAGALGLRFGRMQARLHTARPPERLRRLGDGWLAWGQPDATLRAALQAGSRQDNALLHLDYHPMNVMVQPGRTCGVLDWSNATLGEPRADVARTLTILTLLPIPGWGDPGHAGVRRHFVRGYLRGYQQTAGALGNLDLFLAWAGGAMLRDLEPKLGRAGFWLRPEDLDGVRRAVARWRERAGLPPARP
ncbi:MAG TPA: phosphotransferase [Thermomicrobiaceae bacterium]|nr:phosphotransferase [Thermomicrobiaceae bacterium]